VLRLKSARMLAQQAYCPSGPVCPNCYAIGGLTLASVYICAKHLCTHVGKVQQLRLQCTASISKHAAYHINTAHTCCVAVQTLQQ
jgi:hypothetical protein